jgi:hypothetical protein
MQVRALFAKIDVYRGRHLPNNKVCEISVSRKLHNLSDIFETKHNLKQNRYRPQDAEFGKTKHKKGVLFLLKEYLDRNKIYASYTILSRFLIGNFPVGMWWLFGGCGGSVS